MIRMIFFIRHFCYRRVTEIVKSETPYSSSSNRPRKITLFVLSITLLAAVQALSAQWQKITVDTTASLRGLSVVNEKIVWASGTGGTVIRTIDGGKTWKVMIVAGAEKLDFRDIEAHDAYTAYVLSIGNGEKSKVYITQSGDNVEMWKPFFVNKDERAFFDAIACWDRQSCLAMSDPVDDYFVIKQIEYRHLLGGTFDISAKMPRTRQGEAAFAASGTCLITSGQNILFMVSGGSDARVFKSVDRGLNWEVFSTPIVKGTPGSGIFSIAMYDSKKGVIVGGNYEKPNEAKDNLAFTTDGGEIWKLGNGLSGYRSGVTYVDKKTIIAVGTNGSDITRDGGKTWKILGKEDLNAVQSKGRKATWAVGPSGAVYKLK
jgi:photosystem II stability/assembly factor-like uncharacterized protein